MKQVKVTMTECVFEELKVSLRWDGRERSTYLLCHSASLEDSLKLMPWKVIVPEESDYDHRSAGYLVLSKEFISRAVNEAIDSQSDIIQCHIHPGDPGIFSGIDAREEPMLMRHVAGSVSGIYHGSLVFGNSMDTLDGWFYDRETDFLVPIEKVVVVGCDGFEVYLPHRSDLAGVSTGEVLDRTVRAFGPEAVRMLRMLDFGVVGASALGGPVLEFLARDRVRSITLCDMDVIEETNLNRMLGAGPDVIGIEKALFYADYLYRVAPEVVVSAFDESFYEAHVQQAFAMVDVMVGCVDSGARLSMNQLALANLVPYFDLGAGIVVEDGKPIYIGGQVYSVIPGRGVCLNCSGMFNNMMQDYLSPGQRAAEIERGYIKGEKVVSPLVSFLDYAVAGIGYQQMLKYLWSDSSVFSVNYDGANLTLFAADCETDGCLACREYLGLGDKVPQMVPAEDIVLPKVA